MKNVFLFPGQGAQKKGMFLDICEKYPVAMNVVKLAEEIANEPVSKYMWETDDEELSLSDRSQLAITTASLAVVKLLNYAGLSRRFAPVFRWASSRHCVRQAFFRLKRRFALLKSAAKSCKKRVMLFLPLLPEANQAWQL